MTRALAFLCVLLACICHAQSAQAEPRVEMHAAVDPQIVEVGDHFTYQVQALVHDGSMPTDPQPGPLGKFQIKGARSAPVPQMDITLNGVHSVMTGIVASWTLLATQEGTFTIGPGSAMAAGTRRTAPPVKVKVVGKGKGPRRADPSGSPLSPFMQMFDLGNDEPRRQPDPPPVDASLNLAEPRSPIAFLHATVDKTHAVIGEQVTFTVLLYEDPYANQGQPKDVHEANTTDFLKRSLTEDDMSTKTLGYASIGDRQWRVKQIRKNALFPMKTGRLVIEPMSLTLPNARVGLRESETIDVDVTDPPIANRPPGYAVGDVGDFALSAVVSPRSIKQESAVGVSIELRGTGNLPEKLTLPIATGVEWLEAEKNAKLGDAGKDRFGGTRTFSYVVRIHKSGSIDLGEIKLPFYDPVKQVYGVAKASLGIIDVSPGTTRDAGADENEKMLDGLPQARASMDGAGAESFLAERSVYWGLLFGSPAACAMVVAAERIVRRARERREARESSPEKLAKDRQREADEACKGTDGNAALGAIARAIGASVLAKTGINVKGAASSTVRAELGEAGIENADAIMGLLRSIEDARFSPDGTTIDDARKLWTRAKSELGT